MIIWLNIFYFNSENDIINDLDENVILNQNHLSESFSNVSSNFYSNSSSDESSFNENNINNYDEDGPDEEPKNNI